MAPITDNIAFLTEAREKLEELDLLKDRQRQLKADEARLGKLLENEKKAVNDNISATVKKRREEINSSYDKEIAKGQDKLKKARAEREKAKNQGMKERIAEETADLHKENRDLKLQIRTMFQKNGVAAVCNSSLYYALFFPRWIDEILKLIAAVLICFLLIPYGIYMALPQQKTWMMFLICFLCVVVFGGIYILISNKTKLVHMETLRRGRTLRDQMRSNRKKIRVITSSIKKDKNESIYNLEKYDDDIAKVEQELQNITNKKKEALGWGTEISGSLYGADVCIPFRLGGGAAL